MYGLVLEGGGAKGAYQIGSYFALKEMGYTFDAVTGTSIGAINGAFIVMGEATKCMNMWQTLSFDDFIEEKDSEETKAYEKSKRIDTTAYMEAVKNKFSEILHEKQISMNNVKDIIESEDEKNEHSIGIDIVKNKLSGFIRDKQIPLYPLKNLVNENIDEEKIRKSGMDFGIVTVNLTDRKGEKLFLKDIPKGELNKYIIASAYFPLFQMEELGGKYYLDGGLYDNIPYDMIMEKGLIPVIIRTRPNDIMDKFPDNAIVIAPRKKYLASMDFNPKLAEKIIRIGYLDTFKQLKGFLGDRYYIKPFDEDEAYDLIQEIFISKINDISLDKFKNSSKYRVLYEEVIPKLGSDLGLNAKFTYREFLVKFVEKEANKKNVDNLKIYRIRDLIREI